MKDYISLMSDEEFEWICGEISGKQFREYFKRNRKEFQKIVFGKRPEKQNDKECIQIVLKNKDKNFIVGYINHIINGWLSSISDYLGKKECPDSVEGISETLFNSHFADHISLYFKLTEKNVTQEYIEKVNKYICKIHEKSEKEQQAESEETEEKQTAPDTISEMETRLSEMEQREQKALEQYETEKTARESDAVHHKEELELLKKQLSDSQTTISRLETERNRLIVFDDSEVIRRISSNYQHISLCQLAGYNSYNALYANRLADVNAMGVIYSFISDPFQDKKFSNRDRLYPQGGPTEIGQFGIWQWSAEQNYSDPSKDFLKYKFDPDMIPTEIIYLSECYTFDDVIQQLKSGVKIFPVSQKSIFAVRYDNGFIQGVCCTESQLETNDGLVKLNEQVTALPVYQFEDKNCIQIANKVFYNNISLGKPVKVASIKDSFEMIRQIILENINWISFKQRGINKAEWRNYRAYIEKLHSTEIITRISKECLCSEKEAEELLREFTDRAAQYIAGDSIEDKILLSVISVNAELVERCKGLIAADWQEENRQKIDEANRAIQEKTGQIEALSAEKIKIENNIENLTMTKEHIEQEIHEKEKLAIDVQNNVEDIIAKAQEHAAEFMASMAFVNATGNTPAAVEKGSGSCFTSGITIQSEQAEEYEDWKDLIDNLSENLVKAGVCDDYSKSFAAFLYSSYLNHFPLLLSGPNASEIADAFSASLSGKTAGTLECAGAYDSSIISAALVSQDEIIKVVNLFASEWICRITELRTYSGKYYFAVHPFAEDLAIEPKGITNYFYPVLTEMLVLGNPDCDFSSGHRSEKYQEYQYIIPKGKKAGILKNMRMSMMTYNRINDVIVNLHKMLEDNSIDYDVLYAILPYAYMTMQTDKLLDAVNQKKITVSKDLSDELNRLFGDE